MAALTREQERHVRYLAADVIEGFHDRLRAREAVKDAESKLQLARFRLENAEKRYGYSRGGLTPRHSCQLDDDALHPIQARADMRDDLSIHSQLSVLALTHPRKRAASVLSSRPARRCRLRPGSVADLPRGARPAGPDNDASGRAKVLVT